MQSLQCLLRCLSAAGIILLGHRAAALNVLDLSSQRWTVESQSLNISARGQIPSHVHLDLFAAGIIGDPYVQYLESVFRSLRC
jgi:beta-mannosidase